VGSLSLFIIQLPSLPSRCFAQTTFPTCLLVLYHTPFTRIGQTTYVFGFLFFLLAKIWQNDKSNCILFVCLENISYGNKQLSISMRAGMGCLCCGLETLF